MKEANRSIEKRAGEFIINNLLRIIIYVSVLFIFIPNYAGAIWVYSITIHIMLIVMLSMLMSHDEKDITEKALSYKELMFMFVEGVVLALIMLLKGYLYNSFVTITYSLIVLIEIKEFRDYRIRKSLEKI